MQLTTTKDIFLANVTNKHNVIDMLSRYLQREGCVTHHARGGADLLIAHTAVQSAASKKHCSHSRRHGLGHSSVLLSRISWILLDHAVLSKVVNEEGPRLEHQNHPK